MFCYHISGLNLASDTALPGLIASAPDAYPDVLVRRAEIPAELEDAPQIGPIWQFTDDRFLMRIPGISCAMRRCGAIRREPSRPRFSSPGMSRLLRKSPAR